MKKFRRSKIADVLAAFFVINPQGRCVMKILVEGKQEEFIVKQ